MPNKPENIFPTFNAGDPASKALNHKFLNNVGNSIANLSQRTIGQPGITNGAATFQPPILPGADIRLGKVLEVEDATGDFKGPLGAVNVIKFEVIDALFDETVGQQALTEQDASSNIIYAAAPTSFSALVNDFAWVTKWSGQWWVLTGGGGGGSSIIMFEIIDTEECGTGCVDATVELLACGFSGLNVGDEISIKDEAGCFFNVDPVFLLGVKGFAVKMDGDSDCTPYDTEDCHWVVISLCCALGGCP